MGDKVMRDYFSFESSNSSLVLDIESDCIISAFAEGQNPDPEKYIILQRLEEDSLYFYEICGRESSGYGGFFSVVFDRINSLIDIDFSKELIEKYDCQGVRIKLIDDAEKIDIELFERIFRNTDCKFYSK